MTAAYLTSAELDSNGDATNISGLFQDLLHIMEERHNFTAHTAMPKDYKWGAYDKDHLTWNGMVGMLINKKADIATAALTPTLERSEAISFSIPLQNDIVTLMAPVKKGQETQFWVYMDIFPFIIWLTLVCMIISTCVGFFIINLSGVNSFHKSPNSEEFGIDNSFALSILLLLQLSYNVVIEKMSAKVLYFITSIMMYLIFAYYTSDLTARMTSGPPSTPIRSFQDVLEKKYKVIVMDSTSNHDLLRTSDPNSAMYEVYWSQMDGNQNSFVNSDKEAFDKVLTEENTLYFTSLFNDAFDDTRFVRLNMIDSISESVAWGFQNNSELLGFFNHHLFKIQQSGIMNRMTRECKYLGNEDFTFEDAFSLGYKNTLFPFLLLLGGFILSIVMIPIEKCMQAAHNVK
jgi:ABC-type amino acid transport substrate-binding protein